MDESQPSCSSAAAGQEPAAKKNAKKKLQAQSTNCEYTDEVKGQQVVNRVKNSLIIGFLPVQTTSDL